MKWFSSQKSHLPSAWTYKADGVIWRLMPSKDGYLVGEDRNKESKSVSFFCLEADTGEIFWKNLRFEEKWWIGIEAIHHGVLILHGFAAPDLPGHKKIHAAEARSGKHLWSNDDLQFLFAHRESIYGAKDTYEQREFYELALFTGEVVRMVSTGEMNDIKAAAAADISEVVEFPTAIEPHAIDLHPAAPAVKKITTAAAKLEYVEYLEKTGMYIFGSYENTGTMEAEPKFLQRITIIGKENLRTVFDDVAYTGTVSIVPDTFFVKKDSVYFIKNKNVLHAVKLP